jgi:Cft2 family RNA processing exonuclease
MSYIKHYFELYDEMIEEQKKRKNMVITTDQAFQIVCTCLEEENKDKRTSQISRTKKPTDKQIEFLKNHGYTNFDNITKQDAIKLINDIIEKKRVTKK